MSATKSDWVGWIVGAVLCAAMAIFVLWPSLKKKKTSGNGSNDTKPADIDDPQFGADGVAAAGAPVDENGAPRQAVGAAGMPADSAPASNSIKLHRLGPPII